MVTPGIGSWMWLLMLALPWAVWRVWCSLTKGAAVPGTPFVAWLIVVVAPFVVILGVATRGMEFFHPRYLLVSLPGTLMILALVAARARGLGRGLCAVLGASVLIAGCQAWLQRAPLGKEQYREAAVFIAQHFVPGDRVVGMWRTNRILYAHYLIPKLGDDYTRYLEGLVEAEQIEVSRAMQVLPGQKVFLFDRIALRGMTEAVRERLVARGFRDVARQEFLHTGVMVLRR
jgi:hypothetical protein